ncbi:SLC13 family permease [Sinomicrobium weinanense]|uniref:Anion permease n=1 Tax=Sinomicrobium weinanense TaxID=2842200 RepID=A0A926JNR3_9FLAO|nr:SLC13 family permease [Sinomicrobium weinanense]MBC9794596.1 anion permease [Sinomicrobium weinanense]MBU3124081.1 anion permease [Sinomicrobium weinanense]
MDFNLIITLCIIAIGIFLFVKDYFSIDTTSILIMALFIVAGVLSPEEGFSGFNHPATLTLGCMFVVSAGVFHSGLLDGLSTKLVRLARINYFFALVIFCLTAAVFSAFVNDSAVVALLLPIALKVCRESEISPSRLLIPIAFAALFGGTCTLIGTSTNILVSSYAQKYGLEGFGMFEFSLAALCLAAVGFAYILFIGPLLLPKRREASPGLSEEAEKYVTEIMIGQDCPDLEKSIHKTRLVNQFNIQVLSIRRGDKNLFTIQQDTMLREGDILKVIVLPETLNALRNAKGYKIKGDYSEYGFKNDKDERNLYEVIIPFGSSLAGNSLRSINFRRKYKSSVLAIRHRGEIVLEKLSEIKLLEGDMLLILGSQEELDTLSAQRLAITLSEHKTTGVNLRKAIPAVIIALGVVLTAALDLTSILISSMVGSLLLITTATLKPQEAYKAVEWKVIFMMAGVLSMGTALEKTGGAEKIALLVQESLGQYDPRITLSLLYLITFLSTNVLSSKAAAALMTPIVISLASAMGVSERPFLIAVMFACSLTFMTPVSYPTNTMVYAPGNYRFNDFLRIGTPLNLITWVTASFVIPHFFPF